MLNLCACSSVELFKVREFIFASMCVVSSNFCYALHPVVSLALYIEMDGQCGHFRKGDDKNTPL